MSSHVKTHQQKTPDLGGPLVLYHQGVNYLSVHSPPFLCFEVQFVSTLAFLLRQLIYQLKCCLFPFYKGLYGGLELALIWIKLIREPKATPNYCPSWPEDKNQSCSGTTKTIGLASKGLLLRQVYTGNNRDRLRKYKPELWVTLKMDFTHSEKLAKSSIQPKICL